MSSEGSLRTPISMSKRNSFDIPPESSRTVTLIIPKTEIPVAILKEYEADKAKQREKSDQKSKKKSKKKRKKRKNKNSNNRRRASGSSHSSGGRPEYNNRYTKNHKMITSNSTSDFRVFRAKYPTSNPSRIIFRFSSSQGRYLKPKIDKLWLKNRLKSSDLKEVLQAVNNSPIVANSRYPGCCCAFFITLICLAYLCCSISLVFLGLTSMSAWVFRLGIAAIILLFPLIYITTREYSHISKIRKVVVINKMLMRFNEEKFDERGFLWVCGNNCRWLELIVKQPFISEEEYDDLVDEAQGLLDGEAFGMYSSFVGMVEGGEEGGDAAEAFFG